MEILNPRLRPCAWLMAATLTLLASSGCSEFLSPDITSASITLNSPPDSLYTRDNAVTFWWEPDADIERFQLRITQQSGGSINLVFDTIFNDNSLALSFPDDQVYTWQLRGVNEGSQSAWIQRTLFIDRTRPEKATATHLDGDTIPAGATDSLAWYSADFPLAGARYPVGDSLVIFRKNDPTTVGARYYFAVGAPRVQAVSATAPSPFNGPGRYYWQVVSFDLAGNRQVSDQFQFVIQ